MSEARDTNDAGGWSGERLHAYHDGELSGLARWRFERELRRNPSLRAELEELAAVRDLLREQDAAAPSPDLWDGIALRLPAIDAARAEGGAATRPAGRGLPEVLLPWLKPVGAVAAAAAVAAVLLYGGLFQETEAASGGVVRWIDSGERSVLVLDGDPETTIIWVLDGATEGAWIGGGRDVV